MERNPPRTIWLIFFFALQTLAVSGPNEGGGGNGINGRPLESYAVDINQTAEFKQYVLPVIKKVKSLVPVYGDILERATLQKVWYFVPVSLNELASITIGVPFNTQQLAFQNERSVWIDSRHYSSSEVSHRDRANLLVHELVMAEKINYKISQNNLHQLSQNRLPNLPRTIRLTAQDYESVRAVTTFLMSDKIDTMNGDELAMALYNMGVPSYKDNPPLQHSRLPFEIDTRTLARILFSLISEKKMPVQNVAQPSSTCDYDINYSSPDRVLSFVVAAPVDYLTNDGSAKSFVRETFKISDATLFRRDTFDGQATILTVSQPVTQAVVGVERLSLKIFLNLSGIQKLSIISEVYGYEISRNTLDWKPQGQRLLQIGAAGGEIREGINECRLAVD